MRPYLPAARVLLNPWIGFFALILGAWAWLFAMTAAMAGHAGAAALGPGMDWLGPLLARATGALGVHQNHLHSTSLATLIVMWCLMCVAMMAPTALPVLRTYREMVKGNPGQIDRTGFWALFAGYVSIWFGYAGVMAVAQQELAQRGLLTDLGLSASLWFSSLLFTAAAAYQFSGLKHACLSHCRSPMAFFLSHWRDGARGAFAMGLRHGAVCVGCCWALMALAFVGGTMNLAWMGAAMVLMILEKLSAGRWLTVPLGVALGLAAANAALHALMN